MIRSIVVIVIDVVCWCSRDVVWMCVCVVQGVDVVVYACVSYCCYFWYPCRCVPFSFPSLSEWVA